MISKSFSIGGLTYYVIIPELDPSYTITAASPTWTQVCSEGGSYTCSYEMMCRYGANSSWAYGWRSGSITFSNGVWGDPASGVSKVGQVCTGATVTLSPQTSATYHIVVSRYNSSITIKPDYLCGTVTGEVSGRNIILKSSARQGYSFDGYYNSSGGLITNSFNHTISLAITNTIIAKFKEVLPGLYIKINGHWIAANSG